MQYTIIYIVVVGKSISHRNILSVKIDLIIATVGEMTSCQGKWVVVCS